jgi:chromosome segregation ATPase
MPTQPAHESVCQMMARLIKALKQEIKDKEQRILTLNGRLSKLQSQPNPDPALIQEIKADIHDLEAQLPTDRSQLEAAENEFAASCRH